MIQWIQSIWNGWQMNSPMDPFYYVQMEVIWQCGMTVIIMQMELFRFSIRQIINLSLQKQKRGLKNPFFVSIQ